MTRKDYQLIADAFAARLAKIDAEAEEDARRFNVAPEDLGEVENGSDSGEDARDRFHHRQGARYELHQLAQDLARDLKRDNHRFDVHRFLKACGFEV